MNELLIFFNLVCATTPIDQTACQKAIDATTKQVGIDKAYTGVRNNAVDQVKKTVNISPTAVTSIYTASRYETTKKIGLNLPIFSNSDLNIKGVNKDGNQSGNIGLSFHF